MLSVVYYWILTASLWGGGGITRIAQANQLAKEAELAFQQKDFAKASKKYVQLVDSLDAGGEKAVLNLAHSYFNLPDTARAADYYARLLTSADNNIKSVALQQMGVMAAQKNELSEAEHYLQEALKANPKNAVARHNFIKLKQEQKKQDKQPKSPEQDKQKNQDKNPDDKGDKKEDKQENQSKDGQKQNSPNKEEGSDKEQSKSDKSDKNPKDKNSSPQGSEKGNAGNKPDEKKQKDGQEGDDKGNAKGKPKKELNNEGAKGSPKNGQAAKDATKQEAKGKPDLAQQGKEGDEVAADPEQLKKMKISQEKAKMLLETMRNSEVQYLQQRKHYNTTKRDKDKPDW